MIIVAIIVFLLSSCKTDKILSGKYITCSKSNSVESGTLTINQSETRFTYEWNEHLASGLTRGKIKKDKGTIRLTSFIDTLINGEAIILRQ